jgi:hypothetical protein
MIGEFKIKDFDTFITTIHNKFLEASIYEFTNRISDLKNINYGKPTNKKTKIELSKNEIIEISKKILVSTIEYYLTKQDIKTTTTFDSGINESMDEVGNVIQSLEKQIKIELPEEEPIDIKIITPDDEPDYIPPPSGGGGGGFAGGGSSIGNPEDGGLGRPNLTESGLGRERMEFK